MSTKKLQIVGRVITTDETLTQIGAAADAKAVGDLWRTYPDDDDLAWLFEQIGITVDSIGGVMLTDEAGVILLL